MKSVDQWRVGVAGRNLIVETRDEVQAKQQRTRRHCGGKDIPTDALPEIPRQAGTFEVWTLGKKLNNLPSLEDSGLQNIENLWGKVPMGASWQEGCHCPEDPFGSRSGWDGKTSIAPEDFLGNVFLA